jgi:hypothetical protein
MGIGMTLTRQNGSKLWDVEIDSDLRGNDTGGFE